ncbi:MAG: hypothetical protein ABI353_19910 [Isosphaeraceae bacterium]
MRFAKVGDFDEVRHARGPHRHYIGIAWAKHRGPITLEVQALTRDELPYEHDTTRRDREVVEEVLRGVKFGNLLGGTRFKVAKIRYRMTDAVVPLHYEVLTECLVTHLVKQREEAARAKAAKAGANPGETRGRSNGNR